MKRILFLSLAALAVMVSAQAEKLVIKGSDTLGAKLVPQLAEAFKAQNPGTTFEIAAEGSATGIAAITDGTANIGMSSRRVTATEVSTALVNNVNFFPTVIAFDGIGVIVNANSPVSGLTLKQVQQIFTGEITDWSAVGGKPGTIAIYTRNTSSGTYNDFKEMAMSKRDYASSSQKMAGNEQIAAEVGKNPNGIGYVGIAYTKAPGIKAVTLNGVTLSSATVKNHSWPLWRPTFFYTNGSPSGLAKKFIDFALSSSGSAIVSQVGFVPVSN
jgi:phosphate transport system substrate-binding protein